MRAKWTVRWGNPYRIPTGPRVLKEIVVPWDKGDCKKVPAEIAELVDKNPGYVIGWDYIDDRPRRKWSEEAKRNARIKRLCRKYPLFEKEIKARYGG